MDLTQDHGNESTQSSKPLSGRRKINRIIEEDEEEKMINDTLIKKILKESGGSALETIILENVENELSSPIPSDWEQQVRDCLNSHQDLFVPDVNEKGLWRLNEEEHNISSPESSSESSAPTSPTYHKKKSAEPHRQQQPRRRNSNSAAHFVRLIEEALSDLGRATGAEITQWYFCFFSIFLFVRTKQVLIFFRISSHYPELETQTKSLGYSVNAILSSPKYRFIFVKDQVINASNSSRTLWKLSQERHKSEE